MQDRQRVVVTGVGVVCGDTFTPGDFWQGLVQGRSNVRAWSLPALGASFAVRYAAPVDDEGLAAALRRHAPGGLTPDQDRATRFARLAAALALQDAGVQARDIAAERLGLSLGSGVSERDWADMAPALRSAPGEPDWGAVLAAWPRLNPAGGLCRPRHAMLHDIAADHGLRGPLLNLSMACAGATHAIGTAMRMIRRGEIAWMLAGGSDSVLNPSSMLTLHLLGAPSTEIRHGARLCRPFDRHRSGLVAGEGAGVVLLESAAHARARGAPAYAEVCGFGSAADAYKVTAPHPEGEGAALAMTRALRDAGWEAPTVQHVNAHGTSTMLNDVAESAAIRKVFPQARRPGFTVTANKSMLGHLIVACGGPEFIATAFTLKHQTVPPTIHLDEAGEGCDLDYVAHEARACEVHRALTNSFGFGGMNACLALQRHDG